MGFHGPARPSEAECHALKLSRLARLRTPIADATESSAATQSFAVICTGGLPACSVAGSARKDRSRRRKACKCAKKMDLGTYTYQGWKYASGSWCAEAYLFGHVWANIRETWVLPAPLVLLRAWIPLVRNGVQFAKRNKDKVVRAISTSKTLVTMETIADRP